MLKKQLKRQRIHKKIRSEMSGTALRPRLSVFRSSQHIYAQLIDDAKQITLFGVSEKMITVKGTKAEVATVLGKKMGAWPWVRTWSIYAASKAT